MAWWDTLANRIRQAFGGRIPAIPPPIPPVEVENWIQFVMTVTFIATREQSQQRLKYFRNTETNERIEFQRGRPKDELLKKIENWRIMGVLEEVDRPILRQIEGHLGGTCRLTDYAHIQESLAYGAYKHIINYIAEESEKRHLDDIAEGKPKANQYKIVDYTFMFSRNANMLKVPIPDSDKLSDDNEYQRKRAVRDFPSLNDMEEAVSWNQQRTREPTTSDVPMLADLRDVTYDKMVFTLKARIPRDWPDWEPEKIGEEIMRRGG